MADAALFVGDCTFDASFVVDHVPAPDEKVHVEGLIEAAGGVIANAAVACARAGTATRMLMRTGTDFAAAFVIEALAGAGVAVETEVVEGRTCRVVVILEPHGEKRLLLDPGVSLYPSFAAVEAVSLSDVGWVHTAAYGPAAAPLAARCRAAGIPWSVDLEPATLATGLDAHGDLLDGAATVFVNERAARLIGEQPAKALLARGVRSVVLTRGANGIRAVAADGTALDVASPVRPEVRDTTGAGDCLAGWYVAGQLARRPLADLLHDAVCAAALSCESIGAQASFPIPTALARFVARGARSAHPQEA